MLSKSHEAGHLMTSQTFALEGISSLTVTALGEISQGQTQEGLSVRSLERVGSFPM